MNKKNRKNDRKDARNRQEAALHVSKYEKAMGDVCARYARFTGMLATEKELPETVAVRRSGQALPWRCSRAGGVTLSEYRPVTEISYRTDGADTTRTGAHEVMGTGALLNEFADVMQTVK